MFLNKAKKHAHRVGAETAKVLFRIEGINIWQHYSHTNIYIHYSNTLELVKKVILPQQVPDAGGGPISVCFERGGKMASSNDYNLEHKDNKCYEIQINEVLSVVATLYREASGSSSSTYQVKKGKIVVRQRKKSKFGGEGFKGLGIATLQLHTLATNIHPQSLSFDLEKCTATGAKVDVIVTCKVLGQGNVGDETMSTISGCSDLSGGAASFDGEDENARGIEPILEDLEGETEDDHEHVNKDHNHTSGYKSPQKPRPLSLGEDDGQGHVPGQGQSQGQFFDPPFRETVSHEEVERLRVRCVDLEQQVAMHEHNIQAMRAEALAKDRSYAIRSRALVTELEKSRSAAAAATLEASASSSPTSPTSNPSQEGVWVETEALKSELAALKTEHETVSKDHSSALSTIEVLEREIVGYKSTASTAEVEKRTLIKEHKTQSQELKAEIASLKSQLVAVQSMSEAVAREHAAATAIIRTLEGEIEGYKAALNDRSRSKEQADGAAQGEVATLKKALAALRNEGEAVAREYAAAAAKITALEREVAVGKAAAALTISEMEKKLKANTQISSEKDKDQDNSDVEELLQELILTKMRFATHVMDADNERMKLFAMKRKLQWYAERVAALEVASALKG
eukprot:gene5344-10690_t